MRRETKLMAGANILVLVAAAFVIIGMNTPALMEPGPGLVTDDRMPSFEWIGCQDCALLIDDDSAFPSPMEYDVRGNMYKMSQPLDFGTYWWKVRSGRWESQPRELTIVSTVMLSRIRDEMKNTGNTELMVYGGLTGAFILGVNESFETEGEHVIAEQV